MRRAKKNRPTCELRIYETKQKDQYWNIFRKYHYLNHSLNKAARVFVCTLNGDICAFNSVLPFPHPKVKGCWKGHRMVVLPDFQGIGIGRVLSDWTGELLKREGKTYIRTTSNPNLIHVLTKSPKWVTTHYGRLSAGGTTGVMHTKIAEKRGSYSSNRITASFKYIGEKNDEGKDKQ